MSISISVIPLGVENLKRARATLESLAGALASKATDKLRVSVVDAIPLSPFNLTQISGTTLTARDWSQDFAKLQNLDVALSSRASESTLSAIKSKTDNLDVLLSTRASEATLSAIKNALASVATDKFRVSVVDALPESPFNITKIAGTALTGRDWSQDFAKLQNLDTTLSSRASETTLSAIKAQTDKLSFDANNRLAIQNPPNLDVALSTRASESTLSAIAGALASKATDKLRVSVVDVLPRSPFTLYDSAGTELSGYIKNIDTALSSFTGSPGGSAPSKGVVMLGFDGTYLRIIKTTSDGRLLAQLG